MSVEEAHKLNKYQNDFERDPKNLQAAYRFFQALNQHEMHLTVCRLYDQHELYVHSIFGKDEYYDETAEQY